MLISQVFCKLFEVCKSSKYSSGTQLSDDTQLIGLGITPYDPRGNLRVYSVAKDEDKFVRRRQDKSERFQTSSSGFGLGRFFFLNG